MKVRRFIFGFFFLTIGFEFPSAEGACRKLLGFIPFGSPKISDRAESLLQEVSALTIQWEKLFQYIDPGQASKKLEVFPSKSELIEIFGVEEADEKRFRTLLVNLALLIGPRLRSLKHSEVRIPEPLLEAGGKVGELSLSRLEVLEFFINRKLLHLSENPRVAVSLAWMDFETRHGYLGEFHRLLGRTLALASHLPGRFRYLSHPIVTARLFWKGFHYWITRRLINGNFAHPALAEASVEQLAFLLENGALRFAAKTTRLETLPLSFQQKMLDLFKVELVVAKNAREEALFPGEPSRASDPETFTLDVLKTMEEEALREAAESPPVFERIKDKMSPAVSFAWTRAMELTVSGFEKDCEKVRNFIRLTLIKDLEDKFQALKQLIRSRSEVRTRVRTVSREGNEGRLVTGVLDRHRLQKHLGTQWDKEFSEKARAFAAVFLEAEVLSEVLHYRLPPQFAELYLGHPKVRLEGVRILMEAEQREARRSGEERSKVRQAFLEKVASSPATWTAQNPSALTAQFIAQASQSGMFRYFADKPILGRAFALFMTVAMFSIPFVGPSLFRTEKESPIYKMLTERTTLTDDKAFENARWNYLQQYRHHGITSADKKIIAQIFTTPRNELPGSIRQKLTTLEQAPLFDSWAVWFESNLPASSHFLGVSPLREEWTSHSDEMIQILDLLREYKLWELSRVEKISKAVKP